MATATEIGLEHERTFDLFGSEVRLLIGPPLEDGLPSQEVMGLQLEGFLNALHHRLTRFSPDSELSALNADPSRTHRASSILTAAVGAALWAARRSGGLIDPTMVGELERAGYATSRASLRPPPLEEALALAPERRPAAPNPHSRWTEVSLDPSSGLIERPPGIRLDSGGTGKGLAADLGSERLAGYAVHVVDAGGDLRIGGERPAARLVRVEHPLRDRPAMEFELAKGAVASSGIGTRLWRTRNGFAHHLLDPATGEPAWTGVIQATALATSAVEAETLAKMAVLLGPVAGREILADQGGVLVLDDGTVEAVP